jgi:DNA-binding MltR family transcriptional regulator
LSDDDNPSESEYVKIFSEQMLTQESDRGCALVAAAILDNILEKILREQFSSRKKAIKNSVNPLFLVMGPLSSFWAKIQLANSLGLLPEKIYEDLETIRKIRNTFAHHGEPIDFDDEEVAKLINNLNSGQEGLDDLPLGSVKDKNTKHKTETKLLERGFVRLSKSRFVVAISLIHMQFRNILLAYKSKSLPKVYSINQEIIKQIIKAVEVGRDK